MLDRDLSELAAFAAEMESLLADLDLGSMLAGSLSGANLDTLNTDDIGQALSEQMAGTGDALAQDLGREFTGGLEAVGAEAGGQLALGLESGTSGVGGSVAHEVRDEVAAALPDAMSEVGQSAGDELLAGLAAAASGANAGAALGRALGAAGGAGAAAEAGGIAGAEFAHALGDAAAQEAAGALSALGDALSAAAADAAAEAGSSAGGALAASVGDAAAQGAPESAARIGEAIEASLTDQMALAGAAAGDALGAGLVAVAGGDLAAQVGEKLRLGLDDEAQALMDSMPSVVEGSVAALEGGAAAFGAAAADAGEQAGVRFMDGLQQGVSSANIPWGGIPELGQQGANAPDPFVQDPGNSAQWMRQSALAEVQAAQDAARQAAAAAHGALLDAFGSSDWQISGAQFASLTDAGVEQWSAEVESAMRAAGAGGAAQFAAGLRSQFDDLDWSSLTEAQTAALEDTLTASAAAAGRDAGAALGDGVASGIEATLSSDAAFLQAAMDAGMSEPLMNAVQDLRAGIEADIGAIPAELAGAFEGITERFAEEGEQAGTAYALALQSSLNENTAGLRPPGTAESPAPVDYVGAGLSSVGTALPDVEGEADGVAGAVSKMGEAAQGASKGMGGLASVMYGPLGMAMYGLMAVFPELESVFKGLFETTDTVTLSQSALSSAISTSGGTMGDATASYVAGQAQIDGLANSAQQAGVSLATWTEAVLGNKDAQDQVTESVDKLNASQLSHTITADEDATSTGKYTDELRNSAAVANSAKLSTDQLTYANQGLLASMTAQAGQVAASITEQQQLAQATLLLDQNTQIFNATLSGLHAQLQVQAQTSAESTVASLNLGTAQSSLNQSLVNAVSAYSLAQGAAQGYSSLLTSLDGTTTSLFNAQNTLAQDMLNAKTSFDANKDSLDLNTQAGVNDREALSGASTAVIAMGVAQYEATGSLNEANETIQQQINAYIKATGATGQAKTAIEQYLEEITKIPPNVTTTVNANTAPAAAEVAGLEHFIDASGASFTVTANGATNTVHIPGHAGGGPVEADHLYVVGENGPELFAAGASGFITPNDMLKPAALGAGTAGDFAGAAAAGGGTFVATVNVTVQTAGTPEPAELDAWAQHDLAEAVQQSMGRVGMRNSTSYTPYQSSRNRSS